MKKILGLFLSVALLLTSMSSIVLASDQSNVAKKAAIQGKLNTITQKHGGQAVILDNVDPSTLTLKYDTFEEFEEAISSFEIRKATEPSLDTNSSDLVSPLAYNPVFFGDHRVYLGNIQVSTVRQRIQASEYWSDTYQQNLFGSVISQTSYIIGSNYGCTWAESYATNRIIDGGRTIYGEIDGRITLGIAVAGFPIGFTKEATIYDEFYAD